ncbi:Hypp5617 [Branchiostoma lanceolatum]|uniref:Hypp5617 protein n=1 Tax=Branchiostoma lanceolatum TaxID=7740 RepID=A0A8J9W6X1_BRALA|nr:Hypp5617 [Branchiostoma lanceolatum]
MSTDWLTMAVALMAVLATSGALDLRVPVVDMETFDVRSLVYRENENWMLDVTVSWEQPDGVDPEGYMVLLKDPYADVSADPQGMPDDDFIDDWDFDFDMFGPPADAAVTTARQRLEDRGFVFVGTESYSVGDLEFTHDYEIEVVVLNHTDSAGRGAVHRFLTPDCYSRTHDLNFCRQQEVVFASKPANMTLLNVSVTCVEVEADHKSDENSGQSKKNKTVAMATAWISWVRPVQQGGDIILYVIRLEHDGKNVQEGVFDTSVDEDPNRNPLVPILYVIDQVRLNKTYTLKVTPYVNKTGDFSPYGMLAQLTFNTNNLSAERCFPAAGVQGSASAVSGAPVSTPGTVSTFCCLFIVLGLLLDLKIAYLF